LEGKRITEGKRIAKGKLLKKKMAKEELIESFTKNFNIGLRKIKLKKEFIHRP
jgi:hypothetical protein